MINDLIRRVDAVEMLRDKAKGYYVSMFADSGECYVARTVATECAVDVKNMSAVDAVEVVRCKDCKHWGTGYGGETEHIKVCEYANYMVSGNGYCVYGERKMDEEVQHD